MKAISRIAINRTVWLSLALAAVSSFNLFGQDVIQNFLTKVDSSAVLWANIIVVIGLMIRGCKYMLADRHDHGSTFTTLIGAVILLGARAIATFFLPTPAQ